MKLYNANHSPYASRVRIQIYAKNLPVDIVDPPGGMGSDEAKALTPIGKVPMLDTGDGILPESRVILNFLEEKFGGEPLSPADPLAKAKMHAVAQHSDMYLGPALFAIFGSLAGPSDEAAMKEKIDKVNKELSVSNQLLEQAGFSTDKALDLGDICLAPTIKYIVALFPLFGITDALAAYPTVSQWWNWVEQNAAVKKVLDEMDIGIQGFLKKIGKA